MDEDNKENDGWWRASKLLLYINVWRGRGELNWSEIKTERKREPATTRCIPPFFRLSPNKQTNKLTRGTVNKSQRNKRRNIKKKISNEKQNNTRIKKKNNWKKNIGMKIEKNTTRWKHEWKKKK